MQIRGREELLPIAYDRNTVFNYQDYRRLATPIKSLPGDRLITECIYDSTTRPAITLGKSPSPSFPLFFVEKNICAPICPIKNADQHC